MVWMVGLRQQRQLHGRRGGRRAGARPAILVELSTPVSASAQHAHDDRLQILLAPAQEQLGGDVGVDAPGQALDVGRRSLALAMKQQAISDGSANRCSTLLR